MHDVDLKAEFLAAPHADRIMTCLQCGTCSASCPLTNQMDHAPRALFALVRDGAMGPVLSSNTPWTCVSCYTCKVRCPREIPVVELMYHLKQMAQRLGTAPATHKLPHLYQAFADEVRQHGRMNEPLVMARYGLRHPLDGLRNVPLAARMIGRRRIGPRLVHMALQKRWRRFMQQTLERGR